MMTRTPFTGREADGKCSYEWLFQLDVDDTVDVHDETGFRLLITRAESDSIRVQIEFTDRKGK